MLRASNLGEPVTLSNKTGAAGRAYIAAARKLNGVDATSGVPTRMRFFDKWLGRRAAGTSSSSSCEIPGQRRLRVNGSRSCSLTSEFAGSTIRSNILLS